ncbi:MAG: ribonuclease R [Micavibrio sp.]|nr:ribonuclease R [Micavibrio sp.]
MNPQDILDFIKTTPTPVTKRDIARAFGIKGGDRRVALKQILKKLEKDESIIKQAGGVYTIPEGLPAVAVVEVTDIDIDGDVFAKLTEWDEESQGSQPRIEMMPEKKGHPALGIGARVLASLTRVTDSAYEARTIRRIDEEKGRILGLVRETKKGFILQPADKRAKYDFSISFGDEGDAQDGDLAIGEVQPTRGLKHKTVRITEVLGRRGDPKAISLISLYESGLHEKFPDSALQETKGMTVPPLGKRQDLRSIPLVTIDGADARDFDDAVYAEPCQVPGGEDGFHLIVAIADVSYYVRAGKPLDVEAQRRGNSTYFPDRVVPMLPEALSNDLCSLRPNEDRAALAAHMWIDKNGKLVKHKFVRALIRSHARLIYEQVQAAHDGVTDDKTEGLVDTIITPLYEVFEVLDKARRKRGALDLDLPERQILIDENGNMNGVKQRIRLDAHKLIEEFMILANVAAAQALENKRAPCVYRVHDKPSMDKLESAREFLESFRLSLPKAENIQPAKLNHILAKASDMPYSHLISQVILRTQSQAVYSSENIGHFGLALEKYGHFTSPIRRYADLLVHRSLVSAYGLGEGGLSDAEEAALDGICAHISGTERASMEAERNATDRFTAAYLSEKIGAEFAGRISGVTRFGLFVTLHESGADGLVPMKSLSNDFYVHDEHAHALIGRRKKIVFRLGGEVTVKLKEADGLTGSTVLELSEDSLRNGADIPGMEAPNRNSGSGRAGPGKRSSRKPSPRKGPKADPGDRKQVKAVHKKARKKTTPKHKRKKKNKE